MNKTLLAVVVAGLMIATSAVYFIETAEEFEEQDMLKGIFFLAVAVAYVPIGLWMFKKKQAPHVIAIVGSIALIALYAVTRTDLAILFGMNAGKIGMMGMTSKILQFAIIAGSSVAILQMRRSNMGVIAR